MKSFEYIVKDQAGIHARSASLLGAAASEYKSKVTIEKNGKRAAAEQLLALMALGVSCGDKVIFSMEGEDEERAAEELEAFCKRNL